jgi:hypothetical protein
MAHFQPHTESVAEKPEMELLLIPTGSDLLGSKPRIWDMASMKEELPDSEYLGLMQTWKTFGKIS